MEIERRVANNRGPTRFLVEIEPAGVSDTVLRAIILAHTWLDEVRVTALAEDHVIVDADALLRLQQTVKADGAVNAARSG